MTNNHEQSLSEIIELAVMLRIPTLYLEILLNKLHTLEPVEARLVLEELRSLSERKEQYNHAAQRYEQFWSQLARKLEGNLAAEAAAIERELVDSLCAAANE